MTKASDLRALVREVRGRLGDPYVIEIRRSSLSIRPKGSRSPRVRVDLEWGGLYVRALTAALEAEAREKRKARKRGRS